LNQESILILFNPHRITLLPRQSPLHQQLFMSKHRLVSQHRNATLTELLQMGSASVNLGILVQTAIRKFNVPATATAMDRARTICVSAVLDSRDLTAQLWLLASTTALVTENVGMVVARAMLVMKELTAPTQSLGET
jgi:hypothetical protein